MPVNTLRHLLTAWPASSRVGQCAALAAIILLLGNDGLETAIANGDTRTLSLHHMHTDEDITITYKRNGQYDEEALKKLDWFVRDWRKEESIHMDPAAVRPHLGGLPGVGGDKTIQVVCGYRSPATNAMLRRRSNGVARFSQHMLGKAMDFYIPGVPLEDLRIAGLRMQRGGVGYYPSSGSPFVHLDVGSVRYWPRMTHDQLARVFPNGRTAYLPSDGRPLSGYAVALADVEKRGSTRTAGGDGAPRKKSPLVAFLTGDGGDDADAVPSAANAAATRRDTYKLASTTTKAEPTRAVAAAAPVVAAPASVPVPAPVPAARPQPQRAAPVVASNTVAAVAAPAASMVVASMGVGTTATASLAVATTAVATPAAAPLAAKAIDSSRSDWSPSRRGRPHPSRWRAHRRRSRRARSLIRKSPAARCRGRHRGQETIAFRLTWCSPTPRSLRVRTTTS